jgi:uncharacterized protein YwqG
MPEPLSAKPHRFDEHYGCGVVAALAVLFVVSVWWATRRPSVGIPLAAVVLAAITLFLRYANRRTREEQAGEEARLRSIAPPAGSNWRTLLEAESLGALVEGLRPLVRPAVRLGTRPASDFRLGQSRIGGAPDLPADLAWPSHEGQALTFLAQVDLAEVSALLPDSRLPPDGHLWFFYSSEQPWGFDPKDAGGSLVIYRPAATPLVHAPPADGAFAPCALELTVFDDIPDLDDDHPLLPLLDEWEQERYFTVRGYLSSGGRGPGHKLLGYADAVQGPMALECQLVTNGLYCGDPSGYEDPRAKELASGSREWRLLLQIDSDDSAQMMWGDSGRLYFWIREEDLDQARFDRAWTILQCH